MWLFFVKLWIWKYEGTRANVTIVLLLINLLFIVYLRKEASQVTKISSDVSNN